VLTWEPIDLDGINRHCGTRLRREDFVAHRVSTLMARLTPRAGFSLWKHNQLSRIARRIGAQCDVIIGANGEADLGPRAVQYIHFPRYEDPRLRGGRVARDPGAFKWYHRSPYVMRLYFRVCAVGSGYSMERMRRSLTLVNSDWTGTYYRNVHGVAAMTLYPPVTNDFPRVDWAAREMGFICVGRISPEKRIELMADVLCEVRRRGHDVRLRIAGVRDCNDEYFDVVRSLLDRHADWITLHLDLPRPALAQLVAAQRYGIHGMKGEHFGMAVGEMVNAGCIVFTPNDGGQVEIIGDYPDLVYGTREEAVNKIDALLRDPARQEAARAHLAQRRKKFSTDAFVAGIRAVVETVTRDSR
jgi:glycosyltransferase involved in cell wall biosynthesis